MDIGDYFAPAIASAIGSTAAVIAVLKVVGGRLTKAADALIAAKIKESSTVAVEKIKTDLAGDIAVLKANIDRQNERNKFDLAKYGDLWGSLAKLREVGNALWKEADRFNLRSFQTELRNARVKIDSLSYLLPQSQCDALKEIIDAMERFNVGKEELVALRDAQIDDDMSDNEAINLINQNRTSWRKYNDLIDQARDQHHRYLSSLIDPRAVAPL